MDEISLNNPVFVTYAIASALLVLKIMGQGWMTVYRMMRTNGGFVSPEDLRKTPLNPNPRPEQLELDDYVDRSRRMHRNDLENIPGFWMAGFLLVMVSPPLWLAQILMYGFVAARAAHAVAYATRQTHDVRATFYTAGSLIVIFMAFYVLATLVI
ncbi:MAPEG family protein [Ruegeria marina]|uniref:Microsomal glutathione S-transferase 1 n=1 Tax=Ruegeria marina TaxID=639004 RepID=A0A1G6ITR7_9RHOB|nr:MAPEG family protein [Ruegeria marina]SDC09889.1 glutathione S-transferase [Ruegeria marina]